MSPQIKALVIRPRGILDARVIDDTLDAMRGLLGGYLEMPWWVPSGSRPGIRVALFCNEDGKRLQLPPNVYSEFLNDAIVGTVVIVAVEEGGDTVSLTDEEMAQVTVLLEPLSVYGLPTLRIAD